jgi:hypothetical protein
MILLQSIKQYRDGDFQSHRMVTGTEPPTNVLMYMVCMAAGQCAVAASSKVLIMTAYLLLVSLSVGYLVGCWLIDDRCFICQTADALLLYNYLSVY